MAENGNKNIKISIGMLSIVVLLVAQIVLFAYGYGLLNQQVQFNRELIASYQTTQGTIAQSLTELTVRISKLETLIQKQ